MTSLHETHETKLPKDLSADQRKSLYLVMGGHIYFQTLSAAVQFDLFGLLSRKGALTLSEIAANLSIQQKPARILMLGLTSLGLILKNGDHYSNSEVAESCLVREAPESVVPIIEWQHFINYKPMYWLYDSIREATNVGLQEHTGSEPTLYQRLTHTPELEAIFQNAMQSISVQANKLLVDHVDLGDVDFLVDVGGGNGANIITLARKFSHLKAAVFDSPTVCNIADEKIADSGLSDRLQTIPGNCFETPFPKEADCLLFCHFFTIWSEQQNKQLLQKAYDSLPRGGRVVIFNMMQHDTEDGPLSAAMGSPYFLTLATGQGMLYTWSEYESWLAESGFRNIERTQLPLDHGVITGTK